MLAPLDSEAADHMNVTSTEGRGAHVAPEVEAGWWTCLLKNYEGLERWKSLQL